MKPGNAQEKFQRLLATARQVQGRLLFLPAVAVGGSAAAIYARHRVSLDVDFVSPYLRERFEEVESALGEIPGFTFARLRRPVLILGRVGEDEVGVRQLRREEPLEAVEHEGLWLPTLAGLTAAGALTAFAEAAHDNPADSSGVDLRQWRALRAEYQDLNRVRSVCEQFALNVIESQAAT
ncbi:MAG: hypothetical protein KJ072_13175 [Verrucomicrobia bacterium]|nr:hypothetical protein [Verrucomicrobiota bacterium]